MVRVAVVIPIVLAVHDPTIIQESNLSQPRLRDMSAIPGAVPESEETSQESARLPYDPTHPDRFAPDLASPSGDVQEPAPTSRPERDRDVAGPGAGTAPLDRDPGGVLPDESSTLLDAFDALAPLLPSVQASVTRALEAGGSRTTTEHAAVLRAVVDHLDRELVAEPLERTGRLWDLSNDELGRMLGIDAEELARWVSDGPPPDRRAAVVLLGQVTDLLDRWVKRERIAAVVRRPVEALGGRSRLEVALAGQLEVLHDELSRTFDVHRIAP
jgi:hypothetical protein